MIYPAYQWGGGYSKSEIDTLLTGKADTSHTHTKSQITDFPTIPTKTSDLTNDSCIPLSGTNSITGTGFFKSTSDSQLQIGSGTSTITGGCFIAYGSDYSNTELSGSFRIRARTTSNYDLLGKSDGTLTWGTKNVAMYEDVVPRSGGYVLNGTEFSRPDSSGYVTICGGYGQQGGAFLALHGKGYTNANWLLRTTNGSNLTKSFLGGYDGTLTWDGTAIQYVSDQRLKQQISEIDDKLLDAWEDVTLCQFKYNDAVEQKGKDNARLHTGYVVQQIDEACQKHDVDISDYGLYCHEEYPERTEEVTIENEDGTTSKETKVIEPAKEYYSLRYTETLVVECAYLRRENTRLKERLQQHDEYFSNIEKRLQSLENS